MKTTAMPRKVLLAALIALAPAGAAFAAQPALGMQDCSADAHASYHRGLGGDDPGYQCVPAAGQTYGAAGPAGPIIAAADTTCGPDPFNGYWRAFGAGGPAHLCGLMVPEQGGARGPAGPVMSYERGAADPFWGYERTFPIGD